LWEVVKALEHEGQDDDLVAVSDTGSDPAVGVTRYTLCVRGRLDAIRRLAADSA
jgi:hypothetical protein